MKYLFEQGRIEGEEFVAMAWAMSGQLSADTQDEAIAKVRAYFPWDQWQVIVNGRSIVFAANGKALRLLAK